MVGFYSSFIISVVAVISSLLILNVPILVAFVDNLLVPLEALGVALLIRANLIDYTLGKIQDWLLFVAVQFLVVVPSAIFYVETNAYFGYWPHVWDSLGFALLLRIIVSHMSGGVLLEGLFIMWFTDFLRGKEVYIEHFWR